MELLECFHHTQPHEVVICGLDLIYILFLFLLISKLTSWIVKYFQEIHLGIYLGYSRFHTHIGRWIIFIKLGSREFGHTPKAINSSFYL